ncbi:hypothetical protein QCA50_016591 [Cerrena zonata]|uniref:SET domain-containing protein n=1 Tax=Cerrena zonata TaxID=2478898 RepID=A0AAW0FHW2_9APHY
MKGFFRRKLFAKAETETTPQGKIKIPSEPLSLEVPETKTDVKVQDDSKPNIFFCTMPPHNVDRPNEPETECMLRIGMKEHILSIPGFPEPVPTSDPTRYVIKPVKGGGIGLVATMNIDVGELIVAERPLTLSTMTVPATGSSSVQQPTELQRMMIERLREKEYEEYFALNNCKGYTRPHVTGIADTNAVCIGSLPGYDKECAAVCKVISRVRHSCCCNAVWVFHLESFTIQLRAVLPIKKGKEITISWGEITDPRVDRQKYLLEKYKFECTCTACATESPESDQARAEAVSKSHANECSDDSALERWVDDPTLPDDLIISECHKMIDIYDKEQLYSTELWAVWYQRIVKAYCTLKDKKNARKWAERAAKLSRAHVLHDAGWDAVAKDPKNTDWWGARASARTRNRIRTESPKLEAIHFEKDIGGNGLVELQPIFTSTGRRGR